MKLRYILGIPGSGKSTLCINEIIKSSREGRPALYIVPEQFSLESERLLSAASKNNVLMNSEVLSFAHLAHRMLLKTGGSSEKILDDTGKVLLLRKIINGLIKKDSLVFYGKSAARQGFIDNISALITEFVRYSIPPQLITEKSKAFEKNDKALWGKLHDIGLIYGSFNKNISERYIAKDSLLDILAQRIPISSMFNDTEIWIDSFTDFTPQEFKVIEALLRACVRVNISLTVHSPVTGEAELNAFDPYFEAKRSIRQINRIAQKIGCEKEPQVFLNEDLRHSNSPEIRHLTYNYFNGEKFDGQCGNIKIYSASSTDNELNKAAGEILSLLRNKENPYHCSDIAVLVSSESYNLPLKNIFEKYNIPYFTDVRRDILSHPLTELLRCFFKLLNTGYSTVQVFRMLKTGFNDFTAEEIYLAENYCIACGIKGNRWFNEWEFTISGKYKDKLNDLNDIRTNICDMLEHISSLKNNKNNTIKTISEGIYGLFDYFRVKDRLSDLINQAKENNDEDAIRIHNQIWDILGDIFNKMCEIMGEDIITINDYGKLLEAGLQNASLSLIPPTCDSVTIAQFNRSRLPNIKALFMLGANEGIVPPHHNDTNILSDSDRAALAENGCELGGDSLRLINRDRYNIYSYITKPSERLYISCNTALESGLKSSLIQDLCTCFDIKAEEIISLASGCDGIYSREQAFELLLKHLASLDKAEDISPLYKAVYANLSEEESFARRLKEVSSWLNFADPTLEEISKELAKQLYLTDNDSLVSGITGLQDYASCPYMYFLKHGLKAFEREEYSPSFSDYGTFLHNVLKSFSDRVQRDIGWENINTKYINDNVAAIVDETISDCNAGFFNSSAANRYIGEQLKKTAASTIKAFSQSMGGFVPCGYEITFGPTPDTKLPPLKYDLNDNTRLILTGSIDRVDLYTDELNDTYVKITDYKSSRTKNNIFSEENMFLGVQLQLPLYMEAYTQSQKNAKPGGFFYFKIGNPVFASDKANAFAELISGGMAVDRLNVINALNQDEQKKLNGRSSAFVKIPENGIKRLTAHVNNIINRIGQNIISGNIRAIPYLSSKRFTPCSYCEYSAVCCFELCPNKNNKYRSMDKDELEKLHQTIMDNLPDE